MDTGPGLHLRHQSNLQSVQPLKLCDLVSHRSGIARPQDPDQGLAGVVQEAEQWVVAEATLVGRGGLFLLGVAGDQGGIDVQDQTGQFTPSGLRGGYGVSGLVGLQPGDIAGSGPRCRRAFRAAVLMPASTRQAVGVEATGPNTSRWSRSTARSAIASPPSASVTARSTATRPGSCPVPRGRSRHRASEKALVSVVASARSASRREPAWLTTPCPSALTTSLGRDRVVCTQKVPYCWNDWDLKQASSLQLRRHLRFSDHDLDATPDETRRLGNDHTDLGGMETRWCQRWTRQ